MSYMKLLHLELAAVSEDYEVTANCRRMTEMRQSVYLNNILCNALWAGIAQSV
jgi:hypothetical protein